VNGYSILRTITVVEGLEVTRVAAAGRIKLGGGGRREVYLIRLLVVESGASRRTSSSK
jgi:hypothetical protein